MRFDLSSLNRSKTLHPSIHPAKISLKPNNFIRLPSKNVSFNSSSVHLNRNTHSVRFNSNLLWNNALFGKKTSQRSSSSSLMDGKRIGFNSVHYRSMSSEEPPQNFLDSFLKIKERMKSYTKTTPEGMRETPKMTVELLNALDSIKAGNIEEAVKNITKAIEKDSHPNLYIYRIQLNDRFFGSLIKKLPNIPKEQEKEREITKEKMVESRVLLESDLEHVMAIEPMNPFPYIIRGRHKANYFGDPKGAYDDFKTAQELNPHIPEPKVALADWYVQFDKFEEALKIYNQVLLLDIDSKIKNSILCKRGDAFIKWKKWVTGLQSYKEARDKDPEVILPHDSIKRAILQWEKEEKRTLHRKYYVEMNDSINSIIKIINETAQRDKAGKDRVHPNQMAALYMERGYAMAKLQNYLESIQDYKTAIEFAPESSSIRATMATTLHEAGRTEEAIEAISEAIDLTSPDDPVYSYFLNKRGMMLMVSSEYGKALDDFNKAIQVKKDYIQPHFHKVRALHQMKRFEEALKETEWLIDKEPKNPLFHVWRGLTAGEMKDLEALLNGVKKGLEIDRKVVLGHLPEIHGIVSKKIHTISEEKINEALYFANEEIIHGTKNQEVWLVYRGWLHLQMKNYKEAIGDASEALRLQNGLLDGLILRATARISNMEFEGALKDAEEAVRFHPKDKEANRVLKEIKEARKGQYSLAGIPLDREGKISKAWLDKQKDKKGLPTQQNEKGIKEPKLSTKDSK